MAQTEAQATGRLSSGAKASIRPDRAERYLRRTAAWTLLFFLLQGQLGSIWDREWHYFVGRDWFWTPPHTLIYSSVAGAGLIALTVILTDTIRYLKGVPGVNDTSTVCIFKIFHAPLGFIIAGFGALQTLAAAPLDNYWHNLYGIDIALWAPFHMMGVTGGMIGTLGMVYIFASEAAIERESGYPYHRYLGLSLLEWGTLLILAGMINFTLIGFLQFPIATFGLLRIPSYPLPIAIISALVLIGAVRFTQRPGTATLTILLLSLHTVSEGLFVPWAIRTAVVQQDLSYRIPGIIPSFNLTDALLPLIFIVSALIIDGVALWRLRRDHKLGGSLSSILKWVLDSPRATHHPRRLRVFLPVLATRLRLYCCAVSQDQRHYGLRPSGKTKGSTWLLGVLITIPQLLIAPCLIMGTWDLPRVFLEPPGVNIPPELKVQAALIAVPVILASGALGAFLGANFGDIWHWNTR